MDRGMALVFDGGDVLWSRGLPQQPVHHQSAVQPLARAEPTDGSGYANTCSGSATEALDATCVVICGILCNVFFSRQASTARRIPSRWRWLRPGAITSI